MKKIILISCLLFLSNLHSQELTCEQKVKKFLIDKIKKYKSDELIPYYSKKENKWGFFDMKSKIKVTKPIFLNELFFDPKIESYGAFETKEKEMGCDFSLSGSHENYKISEIKALNIVQSEPEIDYSKLINNTISGFEVDNNRIIKFNVKFYNSEINRPIMSLNPILLKGKFYSIIYEQTDKPYSIINQEGKKMPGFENSISYFTQLASFEDADDILFQIKKDKNVSKIKSFLNNKELPDNFTSINENSRDIGYSILSVDNKLGIFDFTTMSWKIKPDSKNDFSDLYYTSLEEVSEQKTIKGVLENRKKVKIFIKNSKNEFYDLDMKIYKPKN